MYNYKKFSTYKLPPKPGFSPDLYYEVLYLALRSLRLF